MFFEMSLSLSPFQMDVMVLVRQLTTKRGPNLALHPIDLKIYILVFDTPTTNLEPGYSHCSLSTTSMGKNSPDTPLFREIFCFWGKNVQTKSSHATPENNLEPLIDHASFPFGGKW